MEQKDTTIQANKRRDERRNRNNVEHHDMNPKHKDITCR